MSNLNLVQSSAEYLLLSLNEDVMSLFDVFAVASITLWFVKAAIADSKRNRFVQLHKDVTFCLRLPKVTNNHIIYMI